jgi:hypothetical protein
LDDDHVAQFKEVCQMSVGILTGQPTEWTGLHQVDQPGSEFEVSVTDVDSGAYGNSWDRKLTE